MRILLLMVLMLVCLPVTGKKAEAKTIKSKQTWYRTGTSADVVSTYAEEKGSYSKVSVTSSNPGVIKVKTAGKKSKVSVKIQKAGKAVLTYNFYKGNKKKSLRTEKITVKVVKYVNPFASFKVGGSNIAAKFNKPHSAESIADFVVESDAVGKLDLKLKKGWKLTRAEYNFDNETIHSLSELNKVSVEGGDYVYVWLKKGSTSFVFALEVEGGDDDDEM